MKKTLFLFVSCLLATMAINAQDLKLDEILKKQATAIGQEKLGKINSIKMVGKMSVMGMEMPMTFYKKRPNKMRQEFEIQGSKMITTYNGTDGYMVNPMMGSTEAQKIEGEQLEQAKDQGNMDGDFFDYKGKGITLELVGTEDVSGKKAYKIKMISKPSKEGETGKTTYHFIDCENFTLVKSTMTMNMQGTETDAEMYYSNYKQIDGVSMFYTMEIKTGGNSMMTMTYDEIKTNEEISDSLFEKPTN